MGIVRASHDSCNNACAGKARSRRTRCRDVIFETLFETLWVSNPIRPRSAASRNRVMRGPGVTQGAKRSQGARSRVIEPRNALFVRADVVRWTEGYLAASQRHEDLSLQPASRDARSASCQGVVVEQRSAL